MMKISCYKKLSLHEESDAIVIAVYKDMPSLRELLGKKVDDELRHILDSGYFKFEEKEIKSFYGRLYGIFKKVYLIGIHSELADAAVYRELGAKFASLLKADKPASCSLIGIEDVYGYRGDFGRSSAFIEGMMFGLYNFDKYKTKKESYQLSELKVITGIKRLQTHIDKHSAEWANIFQQVNITRDLVNTPANELYPAAFAAYVQENAHPDLKLEVFDEAKILEEGLNLVHAVGKGSSNRPYFLHLSYQGEPKSAENIAIVGKGVTFDTGGTSLKPPTGMDAMKDDMAGAAVVLAVANLIASQGLKVNLHVYIPLVENVIGTCAMRPGDIVTSYSGKTVEILNTDAEGRLILADAIFMATKTKPELIIDIATLTGACVVALGEHCAGLFSNSTDLSKNILKVSQSIGEDIWELPLFEGYASRLKSKNADLANMANTGRSGASITAALFLREFVEDCPWIHLDIAATALLEVKHPVFGTGATGFGVRLLYNFIKQHYTND